MHLAVDFEHHNGSGIHLTLHHPRSPCSPAPLPTDLPFSAVLAHDDRRVAYLALRLAKAPTRRLASLKAASCPAPVPLSPGLLVGIRNYVVRLGLGTPPGSYVMIVDTGSALTWVDGSLFNRGKSTTYAPVSCSAPRCRELANATLSRSACSRSDECMYQAYYGDYSFSIGYLGKDTVSFGSRRYANCYFGCGQVKDGYFGRSAGIIGLARNNLSLVYQLAPNLGYSFSYCLPTWASTGYLSIGSYNPAHYSYTPMASRSLDDLLYFVQLANISVAGNALRVSPSKYTSLPMIIDSGTVISRLPPGVYSTLRKAVIVATSGRLTARRVSILDTCFHGQASQLRVPAVNMAFAGGAVLRLAPRNVLIDVDNSTTCLAFARAGSVAIIGNTQQQTFSVVYDVARSRIGFASGGCN